MSAFFVNPHGIYLCHWWNEVGRLINIIQDFQVKFFVEVGCLHGGLAAMLWPLAKFDPTFYYYGFDLNPQNVDPRLLAVAQSPGNFVVDQKGLDAWSSEIVKHVGEDIRAHFGKRAMVYCDGGDKPREMHLYWPVLRPGDLLACHDYSDDPALGGEVFPKDVADLLEQGRRVHQAELVDTRILALEKR